MAFAREIPIGAQRAGAQPIAHQKGDPILAHLARRLAQAAPLQQVRLEGRIKEAVERRTRRPIEQRRQVGSREPALETSRFHQHRQRLGGAVGPLDHRLLHGLVARIGSGVPLFEPGDHLRWLHPAKTSADHHQPERPTLDQHGNTLQSGQVTLIETARRRHHAHLIDQDIQGRAQR